MRNGFGSPTFFGKDVCEIMDIKDIKDSLQNLVSEDHKKELKNLLKEQNNAIVPIDHNKRKIWEVVKTLGSTLSNIDSKFFQKILKEFK